MVGAPPIDGNMAPNDFGKRRKTSKSGKSVKLSVESGDQLSDDLMLQNPGWLFDIGDYTTQLYGDYNKPM